jgi:hypothetical protein
LATGNTTAFNTQYATPGTGRGFSYKLNAERRKSIQNELHALQNAGLVSGAITPPVSRPSSPVHTRRSRKTNRRANRKSRKNRKSRRATARRNRK